MLATDDEQEHRSRLLVSHEGSSLGRLAPRGTGWRSRNAAAARRLLKPLLSPAARFRLQARPNERAEHRLHERVKLCSRCQQMLPVESFTPKPHLSSGHDSWCRLCRNENLRDLEASLK
jgi:hypothetical protein